MAFVALYRTLLLLLMARLALLVERLLQVDLLLLGLGAVALRALLLAPGGILVVACGALLDLLSVRLVVEGHRRLGLLDLLDHDLSWGRGKRRAEGKDHRDHEQRESRHFPHPGTHGLSGTPSHATRRSEGGPTTTNDPARGGDTPCRWDRKR